LKGSKRMESPTEVKVVNFDIPFWNLVGFMLKLVFAAIPAGIILGVIGLVLTYVVLPMVIGLLGLY
jgi:hypothetical protein